MTTRSTRLPRWLDDEVQSFSQRQGEGLSEALRRIVVEWWVGSKLPNVAFRDGLAGRRAALRDGPEIWELVSVAREYGEDRAGLGEHFGWLPPERLDEALEYYAHFPNEIDRLIEENERVARYVRERLG